MITMPKTALKSSDVVRSSIDEKQSVDEPFDEIDTVLQRWNDRFALEGMSFSERYAIGQSDIGFLFRVGIHRSPTKPLEGTVVGKTLEQLDLICVRMRKADCPDRVGKSEGRTSGDDGSQRCLVKINNLPGKNQKPMFILGVESEYPAEHWVTVSVWLERVNKLDDLCAGELYLSAFDISLKPLLFPDKGKHEGMRIGRLVAGHTVNGEIKRGPKIVNDIADDKGPGIGNASISFGNDQILAGLRPVSENDPKWSILHEFFNCKPKFIDMLLSSPNL